MYIAICHHLCSLSACGSTSPFPYSNWLDVGKQRLVVALYVGVVMVVCVHVCVCVCVCCAHRSDSYHFVVETLQEHCICRVYYGYFLVAVQLFVIYTHINLLLFFLSYGSIGVMRSFTSAGKGVFCPLADIWYINDKQKEGQRYSCM